MKLFLIKIGKAINVIQRDGLVRGGRRVIEGGMSLFKRVKPGDVLYIAGGVGDSSRYGCQHQAEELGFQGIDCSVTVLDNPFLPKYADKFKVFIFHRTIFTPNVQKLIERVKEQGKEILFATDDLVFDSKYFKYMNYLQNANKFEKKLYEKGVGEEIVTDPYVKYCVTTTNFLKEKLEEHGKKVFVSTNKLCQEDMKIMNRLLENRKEMDDDIVRIGYFSGTITHNKDFASVDDVIMDLLEKYKNLRLVIVGPLDVDNKLNKYADQVEHLPFVPRDKHFANVSSVDINIAPLEKDNPFCEAKSELKFFEAGAVALPTVAAATGTFKESVEDGVDGFVADTPDQWKEKLEKLILDKNLRKEMGQKAREKVLKKYVTNGQGNREYYEFIKECINRVKA